MSTDRPAGLFLGAAALATGLLAGLFYAYACSVMPGLARTDDPAFVEAMQQINEAILNPVFALSFFGAPVLTAAAAVLAWRSGSGEATRWIVAALALSVAAFVVTIGLNVPLNDDLAIAGDPSRVADLARVRDRFEDRWVACNIVRTVASTAALACLVRALVLHGQLTAALRTR
jgi:uncharacterized membrane protein